MLTTRWIGEPSLKLDQVFVVSNSFGIYTPSFYIDTSDVGKLFPMAYPQALPWQDSILSDSDIALLERISQNANLDVSRQLDEMRSLQSGWLEGEGLAPSEAGLTWLAGVFDQHFPVTMPLPYLYPTPTGGVQAEWSFGPREVTFEVNLDAYSGEWHEFDLEANESCEKTVDCNNDEHWKWLVGRVKDMFGTSI